MRCLRSIGFLLLAAATGVRAQAPAAAYTPLVWDENWSYLSDPLRRLDWSDELKHIRLFGDAYLSLGGQVRERGEYVDYPAWAAQSSHNGYDLQRYLVNSDWHLASAARVFVQLGSSLENGRDGGPRPGIDQSLLYLNQAFIDYSPSEALTVRVGRQLVSLGSTRLFAIGAGLNVQQPFDGARVMLHVDHWSLDLLALRPTQIHEDYFRSEPNPQTETWGLYATHPVPLVPKLNFDLYYIGFDRKSWRYAEGTGREQRETFGSRLWQQSPAWAWDWELTAQTGRFGSNNIRAWATGYHVSHRFVAARGTPRAEIDGGITSGDHQPHDHTLATFNPLFPNGSYLSESLLIGPYNLDIIRPKLEVNVNRKLTFSLNGEFLWRQSLVDGIYNIAGILTHPGLASQRRYVGWQIQTGLNYSFTRHLTGGVTYEHFFPGGFLKQTPPNHNVNFVAPQLTYTF